MIAINNNTNTIQESMITSPAVIPDCFDFDDCSRVLKITEVLTLQSVDVENLVKLKTSGIPYEDSSAWLYGKLYDMAVVANEETYFFDPLDMVENIWYCEFDENDFHTWHTDITDHPPYVGRKIGMVVNLSISNDYRGGDLKFNNGHIMKVPRSQGSIIMYPGFLLNEIEKVTSGKKKILIAWFGGTNLK